MATSLALLLAALAALIPSRMLSLKVSTTALKMNLAMHTLLQQL
jgi:hypothetical protein